VEASRRRRVCIHVRPQRSRRIGFQVSRKSFPTAETTIVVSTDGYFDVYPPVIRTNGDKPAYRGRVAELGTGFRALDETLAVRPSSPALAEAVTIWSAVNGASALDGGMGGGRDGREVEVK